MKKPVPTRITAEPFYQDRDRGRAARMIPTDVGHLTLSECARRCRMHKTTLSERLAKLPLDDPRLLSSQPLRMQKQKTVDPDDDHTGGGNEAWAALSTRSRSHRLADLTPLGTWERRLL